MQPGITGNLEHDRMIADMTARAEKLRQTAENVAVQLAKTSGTGRSPDGVVTVTVAPTGALQDVQLTARAAGMNPAQLSRSIMAAVRAAQTTASQAMVEAFAPLGEGKETMNMILDHIPKTELPAVVQDDLAAVDELDDAEPARPAPVATPSTPRRVSRPPVREDDDENEPW